MVIDWCLWDGEVFVVLFLCDEDDDNEVGESFWVYCCVDDNFVIIDMDNDEINGIICEMLDCGYW